MDAEFYEKDGLRYDRVTKIIDFFQPPELVEWKVKTGLKEAGRISRRALKTGSRVDELISANPYEPAIAKKDSPETASCIEAWDSFVTDHQPKNLIWHETLFSGELEIAGTYDFVWGDYLIDIKTSRKIKPSHFFQLGAYALMKPEIKEVAILRLDKNLGIYELVNSKQLGLSLENCKTGFLHLLGAYRFYQEADLALNSPKAEKEKENDSDISSQQITAADSSI